MLKKLRINTCLSPNLISLYDLSSSIVVVVDVLRATSTIAAALYNGAIKVIPVNSVSVCSQMALSVGGISAGERNGTIAEGLERGNSPIEFSEEVIKNRILVLTTTNGTLTIKLANEMNAEEIITGGFVNLSAVCDFLKSKKKNIFFACAGWKGMVNMEDTLFVGAVICRIIQSMEYELCDASKIAQILYSQAKDNVCEFVVKNNISHYKRLMNYNKDNNSNSYYKDIALCFQEDAFSVLPIYKEGILTNYKF
ncbi:MAG: 2-phosphosulfolactate phosphatase [Chitinophagaceae bacterium]